MALSLGEDRGQESYPIGCVKRRGGARARRLRFKVGYGSKCAAATAATAGLCPGTAAGAVCGAGPDAEALRLEEEEGPSRAASHNEEDDHQHDDDDNGAEPLIAAWSLIRKGRSRWLRPFALRTAQPKLARYCATKSQPTRSE